MNRRRALLALAAAPLSFGCKRTAPAEASPDALAARVRPVLERARVPAIAYAAFDANGGRAGALGEARVRDHLAASADTPFAAASIAKTIVGTAVMLYAVEGRLDLDADVSRYVGMTVAHPAHPRAITTRMLLAHTSSIADDLERLNGGGGTPLGELFAGYLDAGAYHADPPGTRMRYSNAGAALAALVVERAAGMAFSEVTRRRIFEPLGMRSASWRAAPLPADALGHAWRGGRFVEAEPPARAVYPAAGLRASVRDLSRFARAVLRGGELDGARVLPESAVRTMLSAAPPGEALGWQLRTLGGREVVGHEGEDVGASTALYLDRARGAGAVVLANGDAFTSDDASRAAALGDLVVALLEAAPSRAR